MKTIYKERLDKVLEVLDIVYDVYNTYDFSEFIGKTGGDARTYRVYGKDPEHFMICER